MFFFLTYILQYIFSLSKNTHTHTHVPFLFSVCGFSRRQIGSGQTECVKKQKEIT